MGQAFGVITVLGSPASGHVEVATFRQDAPYSDGRHPDRVTFCTAEEDARRRDFTINGLFFDPLEERVLDYVGGQDDLQRRLVRAIGDPFARIAEDKLRMLRAVRFAATFDFALDPATLAAVQRQAHEIVIVSAERVVAELRQMLVHRHRRRSVTLLNETGLLEMLLPEFHGLAPDAGSSWDEASWQRTLTILERLQEPTFAAALAALIREVSHPSGPMILEIERISDRLRLSHAERVGAEWLLQHESEVRRARQLPWPQLQRLLIHPRVGELLGYCRAVAEVLDGSAAEIEYCLQKLTLPPAELDPPPVLTGDDLKARGIPPGPIYREILEAVREAQLEGRIHGQEEALNLALSIHRRQGSS